MSMTKKDYELVAYCLRECLEVTTGHLLPVRSKAETVTQVCYSLATVLSENNPDFDRRRFLNACGVTE